LIKNLFRSSVLLYQSRIFYSSFKKCILDANYIPTDVLDVCGGDGSFCSLLMDGLVTRATNFDRNALCSNSSENTPIIVGDVFSYDFRSLRHSFDVVTFNNSWQLFPDHIWFVNLLCMLRPKYVFISCPTDHTLNSLRSLGYLENIEGSDFSNAVSQLQLSGYRLINGGFCGRSNYVTSRLSFLSHIILFKLFGLYSSKGNVYRYGFFERDNF